MVLCGLPETVDGFDPEWRFWRENRIKGSDEPVSFFTGARMKTTESDKPSAVEPESDGHVAGSILVRDSFDSHRSPPRLDKTAIFADVFLSAEVVPALKPPKKN